MSKIKGIEINTDWWKDVTFPSGLTVDQLTKPTYFHRLKPGQELRTSLGEKYIYGQYMGEFDLNMGDPISIVTETIDDTTELYTFYPAGDTFYMGFMMMDVKPNQWAIARRVLSTITLPSSTDYNDTTNKPLINGNVLQDDHDGTHYGISNIYYAGETITLGSMPIGFELLHTTIDFSAVTLETFDGVGAGKIFIVVRGGDSTNHIIYLYFCFVPEYNQSGQTTGRNVMLVDAYDYETEIYPSPTGVAVFTYDPFAHTLEWDPTFIANHPDKRYTFNTFSQDPDQSTAIFVTYEDDPSMEAFRNTITVSDGAGGMAIDCEWLYNNMPAPTPPPDYSTLLNKPKLNGVTIDGEQTGTDLDISNIYHTNVPGTFTGKTLPMGSELLNSVIDFSGVTVDMLRAWGEAKATGILIYRRDDSGSETYHSAYFWINGTKHTQDHFTIYLDGKCNFSYTAGNWEGADNTNIKVLEYDMDTEEVVWSLPDKRYTFTQFSYDPDSTTYLGVSDQSEGAPELQILLDAITISNVGSVPASIDCEWLYNNQGSGGGGTSNYNLLSNKPMINGIELVGDKTGTDMDVSNIYHLEAVLPITELQVGYDLLNTTLDFSTVTVDTLTSIVEYSMGFVMRGVRMEDRTTFFYLAFYPTFKFESSDEMVVKMWVDAKMSENDDLGMLGTLVFTYDPAAQTLVWDDAFLAAHPDKKYKFTAFSELPDSTTVMYPMFDPATPDLWAAIKITSGNDKLDVDCEFLHGQLGTVSNDVGALEEQVTALSTDVSNKSDIYEVNIAGTMTSVDCEWLYNNQGSGGSTDYNALTNKPKINGVELVGDKESGAFQLVTQDELDNLADDIQNNLNQMGQMLDAKKSDIYNTTIAGAPTAVTCEWLYNNQGSNTNQYKDLFQSMPIADYITNPSFYPVYGQIGSYFLHQTSASSNGLTARCRIITTDENLSGGTLCYYNAYQQIQYATVTADPSGAIPAGYLFSATSGDGLKVAIIFVP